MVLARIAFPANYWYLWSEQAASAEVNPDKSHSRQVAD